MTIQIVRLVKNCFNLELDVEKLGVLIRVSLAYKQRAISDPSLYLVCVK